MVGNVRIALTPHRPKRRTLLLRQSPNNIATFCYTAISFIIKPNQAHELKDISYGYLVANLKLSISEEPITYRCHSCVGRVERCAISDILRS
jgi:hypothetical protein